MNKHINKKATKLLEDYKKVQQRKTEETDRGCLKSVIMLIVLFLFIIFGIVACSTHVNFFFQ
ncbi:TPA: hypothetical protein O2Z46_001128 [Staphylococcus aureus]|uniref:hypothetical protein n=1 Tax=Staphylococcus aureus TaxID=1280 RepID=UPI0001DDA8FC|nr:hypothetical protein [Staphylococcus aureus]HDJ6917260.1 hypothetical protein [Staphylococcus aureus Sa_TPS3169]HDJ6919460.1 hypothetical protein [Staphylococcus aureus Sa_TPS3162]HDJ6927161.1 hypothetical protein [Staphylococcus aureus Sa_TPS3157]HDJ6930775.1 hypothetical protein [Staphylococcus aureus Sa_TPS3148]HDJ6936447.1 hypothetical protein [Staphylococcus aureus Sa_TPS3161]HDJ6941172.1 hypothetical protein [Staphylococcus aureus Sa_TPS3174]HDJ6946938.1 hypothetical protein [Staphy